MLSLPRQVEQNWVCDLFLTTTSFASEHENILKYFLGHHLPWWSVNHLKTEVLRLFLLHHAGLDGDPPAGVAVRALRVVGTHGKIMELLRRFL